MLYEDLTVGPSEESRRKEDRRRRGRRETKDTGGLSRSGVLMSQCGIAGAVTTHPKGGAMSVSRVARERQIGWRATRGNRHAFILHRVSATPTPAVLLSSSKKRRQEGRRHLRGICTLVCPEHKHFLETRKQSRIRAVLRCVLPEGILQNQSQDGDPARKRRRNIAAFHHSSRGYDPGARNSHGRSCRVRTRAGRKIVAKLFDKDNITDTSLNSISFELVEHVRID